MEDYSEPSEERVGLLKRLEDAMRPKGREAWPYSTTVVVQQHRRTATYTDVALCFLPFALFTVYRV
jgi:hypothetical protein